MKNTTKPARRNSHQPRLTGSKSRSRLPTDDGLGQVHTSRPKSQSGLRWGTSQHHILPHSEPQLDKLEPVSGSSIRGGARVHSGDLLAQRAQSAHQMAAGHHTKSQPLLRGNFTGPVLTGEDGRQGVLPRWPHSALRPPLPDQLARPRSVSSIKTNNRAVTLHLTHARHSASAASLSASNLPATTPAAATRPSSTPTGRSRANDQLPMSTALVPATNASPNSRSGNASDDNGTFLTGVYDGAAEESSVQVAPPDVADLHADCHQQIRDRNKMLLSLTQDNMRLVKAIKDREKDLGARADSIGSLRGDVGRLNTMMEHLRLEHAGCIDREAELQEARREAIVAREAAELANNKASRLAAQLSSYSFKHQQMGEEAFFLRDALRSTQKAKHGVQSGNTKLKQKMAEVQRDCLSATNAFGADNEQLRAMLDQTRRAHQGCSQKHESLVQQLHDATSHLTRLKVEFSSFEGQHQGCGKKQEKVSSELLQLREDTCDFEEREHVYQKALADSHRRILVSNNRAKDLEAQVEQVDRLRVEQHQAMRKLEQKLGASSESTEALKHEAKRLRKEHKTAQSSAVQLKHLETVCMRQKSSLEHAEQQINQLEDRAADQADTIADLQARLAKEAQA